jgi:hypothetical protein
MMVGGALVLIVGLLIVSNARGERKPGFESDRGPERVGPSGNYQPAPMLPNVPLTGIEGGSPINDAPDHTVIQDVRDTMRRLPLDRNTPRGWSNPKPRKPG